MMFEGKEQGVDVLWLDDLFDLIGGECVCIDPDEFVSVEGVLADCQVQKEHPIVRKQRSDCIFCVKFLPTLFELFDFLVMPAFGGCARVHLNKLSVLFIPLFLDENTECLVSKDDEIDIHHQQLFKSCEELSSRKLIAGTGGRPPSSHKGRDEGRIWLMGVVAEHNVEKKEDKRDKICCFHGFYYMLNQRRKGYQILRQKGKDPMVTRHGLRLKSKLKVKKNEITIEAVFLGYQIRDSKPFRVYCLLI